MYPLGSLETRPVPNERFPLQLILRKSDSDPAAVLKSDVFKKSVGFGVAICIIGSKTYYTEVSHVLMLFIIHRNAVELKEVFLLRVV
jgi:hypothetical protein